MYEIFRFNLDLHGFVMLLIGIVVCNPWLNSESKQNSRKGLTVNSSDVIWRI